MATNLNNMATSIVQSNEVVKAEDFNFGFDNIVDNISVVSQLLFNPDNDFVVGGKVSAYTGSDMNIVVAPIFGVCKSTLQMFGDTSTSDPVAVETSTSARTAIVEVKGEYEEYDEQQRAFMDYDTSVKHYETTATKKKLVTTIALKYATGSTAPSVDSGYVKIAEIYIPASASSIAACTINNITADYSGLSNSAWTNEKTATYNAGHIDDINKRFRVEHNADGTHAAGIIGASELDAGIESGQVNASTLPIAKEMTIGADTESASTSIQTTLSVIATLITSLYTYYFKNGAYKFNGEVDISSGSSMEYPIKLIGDGTGNASIYIGTQMILKAALSTSGSYLLYIDGTKYSISTTGADSATNKIVTTAVTNAIWSKISTIETDISDLQAEISEIDEYSNNLLSRYSRAGIYPIVATTANITLSGTQTIDGVALSAGNIVIVKDQTDATQNGIYVVQTGTWNRLAAYSTDDSMCFLLFSAAKGSVNAGYMFYSPQTSMTIGTTEITFKKALLSIGANVNTVAMRDSAGAIATASPTDSCDAVNLDYANSCYSPKSHASTATTYGVGNATYYGHVKLSDNYTSSGGAACDSVGASSLAVYCAYNCAYTCGTRKGTASQYGQVELCDNYSSSGGNAAGSVGASSCAVYLAYTYGRCLNNACPSYCYVSNGTGCYTGSAPYAKVLATKAETASYSCCSSTCGCRVHSYECFNIGVLQNNCNVASGYGYVELYTVQTIGGTTCTNKYNSWKFCSDGSFQTSNGRITSIYDSFGGMCVYRYGSSNGASIMFANCLGTLGYIGMNAVDGGLYRWSANTCNTYKVYDTSTTIPVSNGGTGATTAAGALTCLGAAAKCHASSDTTYGAGNATYYGHVKLSDTYDSCCGAAANSLAASQLAVYCAYTCGTRKGNATTFGQVKLCDCYSTTYSSASAGVAASQGAVYCAYCDAVSRINQLWSSYADEQNEGIVWLEDTYDSCCGGVAETCAASQLAVYCAYTCGTRKGNSTTFGQVKVCDVISYRCGCACDSVAASQSAVNTLYGMMAFNSACGNSTVYRSCGLTPRSLCGCSFIKACTAYISSTTTVCGMYIQAPFTGIYFNKSMPTVLPKILVAGFSSCFAYDYCWSGCSMNTGKLLCCCLCCWVAIPLTL